MATAQKLTLKQTAAVFGVTLMCLSTWRKGTPTKDPLPVVQKRGSRFVEVPVSKLKKWAVSNDVSLAREIDDVLADKALQPIKPGPRSQQDDPG